MNYSLENLNQPFTLTGDLPWICPECEKYILRIEETTFHFEESGLSRKACQSNEFWEPDWTEYVYSCILKCTNNRCGAVVANTGVGEWHFEIVEDYQGNPEEVQREVFYPKYFEPTLKLIKVPNNCHEEVAKLLSNSFELFYANPNAAANAVRQAIEVMITKLGVKRYETKNGKRRGISLHKRLDYLPSKYMSYKDKLKAIKWLGNAGSHGESDVEMRDVIDAYYLVQHILEEIYNQKTKKLNELTKLINKKKGPRK